MSAAIHATREGDRARLIVAGRIELSYLTAIGRALADAAPVLEAAPTVDVNLDGVENLDGSGAVMLARLLDRLEASGVGFEIASARNPDASRPIALYRSCHTGLASPRCSAAVSAGSCGSIIGSASRHAGSRTHRPQTLAPGAQRRAERGRRLAVVVIARPLPRLRPEAGFRLERGAAPGRCRRRLHTGGDAHDMASGVRRPHAPRRHDRVRPHDC